MNGFVGCRNSNVVGHYFSNFVSSYHALVKYSKFIFIVVILFWAGELLRAHKEAMFNFIFDIKMVYFDMFFIGC